MPIARLLSLSFGLLTAVSILSVLLLTVAANVENTFSLLNTRARDAVQSLTALVDAYLEPVETTVRSLSRQIERGEIDLDDSDGLSDILRGAITANRMVVVFQVYDLDLRGRGVFRQGSTFGDLPEEVTDNPQIRKAIAALPVDGRPHWGDLVSEDGVTHANVAQALTVGGIHVGYLVAAVPLPRLSALVRQISEQTLGTSFILDGDDRVLAHPLLAGHRPGPIGSRQDPAPHRPLGAAETAPETYVVGRRPEAAATIPLAEIDDPVLAAFPDRDDGEMFVAAAEAGVEVSSIDVGEDNYVVMTTEIDRYAQRPWVVGIHYPRDVVAREIRRLVGSTTIGIVFLVVGAGIAFWLGRRMGRPFAQLNAMARKVTTLDFDEVREMPPSRVREFNESAVTLNRMVDALRAFAAYVPRRLVSRLIEAGGEDAARSHEQVVSLMFTDVVGFTAMSEHMSATETAEFLNHHFSLLCAEIEATGGTVDKFMGDGMMAFWGAPDPLDDHAERACRAAAAIADVLHRDNAARIAAGEVPVHVRMGIHTGPVIVGNIGPSDRMNYTIVGDTVNSCQRLEALGKVVAPGAEVVALVSADTEAALSPAVPCEPLSTFHVPGRDAPINVHRLVFTETAKV